MTMNWLIIPTIVLALILFKVGHLLFVRFNSSQTKFFIIIISFLFSIPGLLFSIYYLHLFDNAECFYWFRSLPFIELTASGAGLFGGVLYGLTYKLNIFSFGFLIIFLCLGIAIPYVKPLIEPIPESYFLDKWSNDVCMQSSSSCGPASVATLLKSAGIKISEKQLARECFAYKGGTEVWYLARAFRKRGFNVTFKIFSDLPNNLPVPSIAGVNLGEVGHFIPIIAKTDNGYITGDPLVGKKVYTKSELFDQYEVTGFFMIIKQRKK